MRESEHNHAPNHNWQYIGRNQWARVRLCFICILLFHFFPIFFSFVFAVWWLGFFREWIFFLVIWNTIRINIGIYNDLCRINCCTQHQFFISTIFMQFWFDFVKTSSTQFVQFYLILLLLFFHFGPHSLTHSVLFIVCFCFLPTIPSISIGRYLFGEFAYIYNL